MVAIDLGLSVMWGSCNIGAKDIYEEGNLYTWKEIVAKVDNLTAIFAPIVIPNSMTCDLAERMFGSGWQVPTKEHIIELMQNCEFEPIWLGTKFIMKATGPNGNSIYLPLAGNRDWNGAKAKGGFYWTSTKAIEDDSCAYQLRIYDQIILGYNDVDVCQSVRPVYSAK